MHLFVASSGSVLHCCFRHNGGVGMDLQTLLTTMPNVILGSVPVHNDEIHRAEERLGIRFADEYCTYLRCTGIAAVNGHELTGLGSSLRTSVVEVTLKERQVSVGTERMYVLEQGNVDGIVIWQDNAGHVYATVHGQCPKHLYCSLVEYLSNE